MDKISDAPLLGLNLVQLFTAESPECVTKSDILEVGKENAIISADCSVSFYFLNNR